MRTRMRWLTAGLVGLALSGWYLAAPERGAVADEKDSGAVKLPEPVFKELVKRALTAADEGLQGAENPAKTKLQKKSNVRKARGAAVMIAVYAQHSQTPANAQERATLRDAALRLAATIKEEKYADARKQVEALKSPLKPDPKADLKPVELMKQVDILEAMKQFSALEGGLKLEKQLIKDWLDNDAASKAKALPPAALNDDYLLLVYQTAMINELIKDHVPKPKDGKGPKDWAAFANSMRADLAELAGAVQKKDGKAAWTALDKVDRSCARCHKPFRDSDD